MKKKSSQSYLFSEPSTGVWNIRNAFTSVTVTPNGVVDSNSLAGGGGVAGAGSGAGVGTTVPDNMVTSTARSAINLAGPTMNDLQDLIGRILII